LGSKSYSLFLTGLTGLSGFQVRLNLVIPYLIRNPGRTAELNIFVEIGKILSVFFRGDKVAHINQITFPGFRIKYGMTYFFSENLNNPDNPVNPVKKRA